VEGAGEYNVIGKRAVPPATHQFSVVPQMNDFSQRFVDALRHAGHSVIRSMAEQAIDDHGGMRVSGRSPGGHPFHVTTASGNEVTVGFGRHWHTHLQEFEVGPENEKPFAHAIKFLVDLVREQIVIVEWYNGREYAGSGARRRGEKTFESNVGNRRVTISWAGSYDGESSAK
jgi:hypothetical protein